MHIRSIALIILAALATSLTARAGILNPGLEAQLQTMHPQDELKVLLVLEARADIESLDEMLRANRSPMAVRHQTVIEALQDVAAESQPQLEAELERLQAGGKVLGYTSHWLLNSFVVRSFASVIPELAQLPGVDVVEADLIPELIEPVSVTEVNREQREIGVTPGIRAIEADRVWYELGITGEGVVVANMDTGVNRNHESLQSRWRGNVAPAEECWRDAYGSSSTPNDGNGHGTHVMGTITGLASNDSIGVCPGALWIATNEISGGAGSTFDNAVIAGLEWLADPDGDPTTHDDMPDVVQHSWRVNEDFTGYVDCDDRWWEAIDNCEAVGVCHTWSAGNEGSGSSTIGSPADRCSSTTNTFSVGSCNTSGTGISSFSSRGPAGGNCGFFNIKPEITAPGSDIYSASASNTTGYVQMSGTSMAGPHVAGVVGLMRGANQDLDVQTIKQIIMESAEDRGSAGEDNTWGWGLINAYACVLESMSGYGTLEGTITAEDSGDPLQGVTVLELDGGRVATTDASGFYSMTLPAGTINLEASFFGFQNSSWSVEVVSGETAVSDQALLRQPSALLSGTVFDAQGLPVEGAIVTALDTPLQPYTTGPDGSYELLLPVGDTITISSRGSALPTSAPQGPDSYGYLAFDNSDTVWASHDVLVESGGVTQNMNSMPVLPFDWTTIDPDDDGPGTALDFSGSDDMTLTIELPFLFNYYGQQYADLSICGNGWVSMGSTTDDDYTNSGIPDPAGPAAMLAPCWEDYSPQQAVSGNISTWHDTAGGRFIVEYNHIRQYSPANAFESFQVILLDPTFFPTATGDGAIIFQYNEITNLESTTIGIESPDSSDGLQYYFAGGGDYADVNLPVTEGSALLFTTGLSQLTPDLQPVDDLAIQRLPDQSLRMSWTAAPAALAYRVESRSNGSAWVALGETAGTEWILPYQVGPHEFRVVALGD